MNEENIEVEIFLKRPLLETEIENITKIYEETRKNFNNNFSNLYGIILKDGKINYINHKDNDDKRYIYIVDCTVEKDKLTYIIDLEFSITYPKIIRAIIGQASCREDGWEGEFVCFLNGEDGFTFIRYKENEDE